MPCIGEPLRTDRAISLQELAPAGLAGEIDLVDLFRPNAKYVVLETWKAKGWSCSLGVSSNKSIVRLSHILAVTPNNCPVVDTVAARRFAALIIQRTSAVALNVIECVTFRMFIGNPASSNMVEVRVSERRFLLQPGARAHGEIDIPTVQLFLSILVDSYLP
jgi:hypothetical protein